MYRAPQRSAASAPRDESTDARRPSPAPRRHLALRTALALSGVAALALVSLAGYATWSSSRDETLAAASQEREQLSRSYEARIQSLRTEIDRLMSRQALTQANLEEQMDMLLQRQQSLQARHSLVSDLVARAERSGLPLALTTPLPERKPDLVDDLAAGPDHLLAIGGESQPLDDPFAALGLRGSSAITPEQDAPAAPGTPVAPIRPQAQLNAQEKQALAQLRSDLSAMDAESAAALQAITLAARSQIDTLTGALRPLGLRLADLRPSTPLLSSPDLAVGGPYEPLLGPGFASSALTAETALNDLDGLKQAIRDLPVAPPTRGTPVSSTFGPRMDPFLGTIAMHTGIDFMAPQGQDVHATGRGTVLSAGRNGGYGNMVEIHHPGGLVTRYAHLSRIFVREGESVAPGDIIGQVGSTGRSTGPHLHYEVRLQNEALDPKPYLNAGKTVSRFL